MYCSAGFLSLFSHSTMSVHAKQSEFMKFLPPALVLAALTILLTGCAQTYEDNENEGAAMSSSSTSVPTQMAPPAGQPAPAASGAAVVPTPTADVTKKTYADGTYAATGDYMSPAGSEEVKVSLTLKSGVITDATYEGTATMGKSQKFQAAFGEGYKEQVVGKSIDSLSLGIVNGSSLTPMGFMDAVAKIKTEASA